VRSIYPSLTYPAHATLMTGCFPDRTGIVNNLAFSDDPEDPAWEWDSNKIRVKNIFTAAKEAGYSTAAVLWPVTGKNADIDSLINEYWMPYPGDTLADSFRGMGSSEETVKIIEKNEVYLPGSYWRTGLANFAVHPIYDIFGVHCACDIIRASAPQVLFLHICPIDGSRHRFGVFSPKLYQALDLIDIQIGEVCEALDDAGVLGDTDVCLISDHGQIDCDRTVYPNVWLSQAGLLEPAPDGGIASWSAMAMPVGMSAYVYLRDPDDAGLRERTAALLGRMAKEGRGVSRVFTADEARRDYHLAGGFSFVLETDGHSSFGRRVTGPDIQPDAPAKPGCSRGGHGYLPDKGPQPVFLAKGPHFRPGARLDGCSLADEAPTFARLLGAPLPDTDGRALTELLQGC
jgi:predicted AlkP superfamily pyrophosphatase or phosphodiesterase